MNILIVAAHPDDEILGCGATLKRLTDEGHHVYSTLLCESADARFNRPQNLTEHCSAAAEAVGISASLHFDFKNIQFNAVPHIKIVQAVEQAILHFQPEWVLTHHPHDLNIDHRICHEATMAAVMLPQRLSTSLSPTMIRRVMLFEVLSSTDWAFPTTPAFLPNTFFDVRATLDAKIAALRSFEGAMKPFPHSRSVENVRHLAALRGAQVGIEAAEAFCTVRELRLA